MKHSPSYVWFIKLNFLILGLVLVVFAIRYINKNGLGPAQEIFGFGPYQPAQVRPSVLNKSIELHRKARLIHPGPSQNVDKDSDAP